MTKEYKEYKELAEKQNKELSHPNLLPNRIYKFRVIGMGLGGIPNAVVMTELNSSLYYWAWWVLSCYIWPQLAYIVAKNSKNPYKSERNNLLFDSFIAGTWAASLHFNLLPSVLLLASTLADKISSGIKNLWAYSIPFMLLGILLAGLITGFAINLDTSFAVIISCLPILVLHTLFVSFGSHKLIRKVQFQNIQFKELSQKDTLTPLLNRRHWQQLAEKTIDKFNNSAEIATLILIDVDKFKQINDGFGHMVGDDVLKAIATILKEYTDDKAIIGRLGGDEFAIIVQNNLKDAVIIAKNICRQVQECKHASIPDLKCTISIGLAQTSEVNNQYRKWFEAADINLYKSKNSCDNQITYC